MCIILALTISPAKKCKNVAKQHTFIFTFQKFINFETIVNSLISSKQKSL